MATTVAELVTRLRREFLEPSDLMPQVCTLDGAIVQGATTLTYDPAMLTAEEETMLGPGTLVEVDWDGTNEAELLLIGSVDETANTLSDLRQLDGTSGVANAHADDAVIRVQPEWSRQAIKDAVGDAIVRLWPDLYAQKESGELTLSSTQYTEAPADCEYPEFFWLKAGTTNDYVKSPVRWLPRFPPSSTNKAFYAATWQGPGNTGYLVYRAKFSRPTAGAAGETEDLQSDLDVNQEWEPVVLVGATAHLIAGRDLHPALETHLAGQLDQSVFPVGSGQSVQQQMLAYFQFLKRQAASDLETLDEIVVVRNGITQS